MKQSTCEIWWQYFCCMGEKFNFRPDFRVNDGLGEQKQCNDSCALGWWLSSDALGLQRGGRSWIRGERIRIRFCSWIRRERIWRRRKRIRASWHSHKVGQRALWEHHWWLPSGHLESQFVCKSDSFFIMQFSRQLLINQAKGVPTLSGETAKWNYFNIVQNCLG